MSFCWVAAKAVLPLERKAHLTKSINFGPRLQKESRNKPTSNTNYYNRSWSDHVRPNDPYSSLVQIKNIISNICILIYKFKLLSRNFELKISSRTLPLLARMKSSLTKNYNTYNNLRRFNLAISYEFSFRHFKSTHESIKIKYINFIFTVSGFYFFRIRKYWIFNENIG